MSFDDLGLGPDVLRAVADAGYVTPTPIQEQSIPAALTGRDILGCAQTGTGKTASFVLPMIEILSAGRARARMPRSLILTPTRELAMQISENFDQYGKFHKLTQALLIGGVSMDEQSKKLGRGVDVLDRYTGPADRSFRERPHPVERYQGAGDRRSRQDARHGVHPRCREDRRRLPKIRQTLFFSATMPPEIRRLADAFLMNPKEIQVTPPASPAETVIQHLAVVAADDKREALRRIIRSEEVQNALVFCNRKRDVDILYRSLKKHGFAVAALHGDMAQPARLQTLDAFRNNEIPILVASDVAARGLDVIGLSHVFNFDVPYNPEDYVHRIGRTGRAGKEGRSFTIAAPEDAEMVAAIVRLIGRDIPAFAVEGLDGGEFGEPAPRRSRRRRPANGEAKAAKPKAAKTKAVQSDAAPAAEQGSAPPRRTRRKPDGGKEKAPPPETVVGMGNHVPAFLLQPARAERAG